MKQLLPFFLFLLPCLALAQYPSNGNQKITLGEQTTADGLIYRGVAADTTLTAKSDTAAYFVLDTVNINLYTYKASATGRKWRQLGADTAAIAYVNTYGDQTVNGAKAFSSTVTGARFDPTSSSASGNGMYLPAANSLGFSTNGTEKIRIMSNGDVGIGISNPTFKLDVAGTARFTGSITSSAINTLISTGGSSILSSQYTGTNGNWFTFQNAGGVSYIGLENSVGTSFGATPYNMLFQTPSNRSIEFLGQSVKRMIITSGDEVLIGYTADQGASKLQVNGSIYAAGTTYPSDERYKENIIPLNKGLDLINKLKPVTFNYINTTENNFSEFEEIGFIAQDVDRALSTESFVKSIVKYSDESNTDSKMVFSPQNLIPILTKAIQEQQALIKALEQRIINLENK
jgi:hypothetical protein